MRESSKKLVCSFEDIWPLVITFAVNDSMQSYFYFSRNMCPRLHILPIGLLLVSLTSFCLTYILSVTRNDVNPVLPYIR